MKSSPESWSERPLARTVPPNKRIERKRGSARILKSGGVPLISKDVWRRLQRVNRRGWGSQLKRLTRAAAFVVLMCAMPGCAAAQRAPRASVPAMTTATQSTPAAVLPPARSHVPNVVGLDVAAAKRKLRDAGFEVRIKWVRSSAKHRRVVSERPSGGLAPRGSQVVLLVHNAAASEPAAGSAATNLPSNDRAAARAFEQHASGIPLSGQGAVVKVLSDDLSGDRHQRFILRLGSGQTLLVAHNIDIAPRVPALSPGAVVAFKGVYQWSPQGGTVHWTHHDPSGSHPPGWLRYKGVTYR